MKKLIRLLASNIVLMFILSFILNVLGIGPWLVDHHSGLSLSMIIGFSGILDLTVGMISLTISWIVVSNNSDISRIKA